MTEFFIILFWIIMLVMAGACVWLIGWIIVIEILVWFERRRMK